MMKAATASLMMFKNVWFFRYEQVKGEVCRTLLCSFTDLAFSRLLFKYN